MTRRTGRGVLRVTVAVVVRDRRERMVRCLDAILAQDYPAFEVLVIDNCSRDGTAEAVVRRSAGAPIPVRVEVEPGSVGRLRNVAVARANGDVIAFTDSDCVPDPSWLAAGVAPLVDDPRLGIVQGQTLPESEPVRRWPNTQHITAPSLLFECCNILYRLDAIRSAAGFDEDLRLSAFGEDVAAGWSVRRAGWGHRFEPAAVVRHDVTYPGLPWHLRRALRYEVFAKLARDYPEIRTELFWGRWFLTRRYAFLPAALVGLGMTRRWPIATLLAAPYVWFRMPSRARWPEVRGQLEGTVYDLAALTGLVRGSVRYRSVVL